jgi:penicillin amidase
MMAKPPNRNPQSKRQPRRRWARYGGYTLLTLAGLFVAGGVGATLFWRASLPELNGQVALPGLSKTADVYRDAHGVPHIFAGSRNDALRVLGYLHASERFFQMEMNRRAGKGRLAEVVGKDMLGTDKFLRALDVYRLAATSYKSFTPAAQAAIAAYCDGVNAWLSTHRHRLPLEFTLLGIEPEPWQPADSLVWAKLMALQLSANLEREMQRGALLAAQPAAVVDRLYPQYPANAPYTTEPRLTRAGLAPVQLTPVKELAQPPLLQKRGAVDPALGAALTQLAAVWPFHAPGASNEWVLGGTRTISGMPILANDPHLSLETPVLWYLARIVTPELYVTGATVPGLPVVLLGQNRYIAWGFTTTNSDVQDLFIETIDPQDPTKYLTPSGSEKFSTRNETFKVKGEPDVTATFRATRHGPVLSDADTDAAKLLQDSQHVVALAFTGLSDHDTTPEALWRLNAARNWQEFQSALELFQTPPQNIVYADWMGHTGFTAPGLVPVRIDGDGRYPVAGADGKHDWRGMIPFTYAPRLRDPDGGAIFNGNNAVTRPGIYWFGRDWETPHRAQRIQDMISAIPRRGVPAVRAMQADILSLPAQELLPMLLHVTPQTAQETQALTLLRGWDATMQADRPEPLLFEWWVMRLYDAVARPPFGALGSVPGQYNAQALAEILRQPAGWCDKLLPEKSADCAPQIAAAFRQTLQELTARYGADVAQWRWGNEHFAPLENKVMHHVPGFDRWFGQHVASDGGFYTVNRGGNFEQMDKPHPLTKTHGSGFRAIYDLADLESSRYIIAGGESAHPLSPYYANLVPLWNSGQDIAITGTKEELAAHNHGHVEFVDAVDSSKK